MVPFLTSVGSTAIHYGVHGLRTIHELCSFYSTRAAFKATDYRELLKVQDPTGEENNRFLMQAVERCSTVVLGWGNRGKYLNRDRQVMSLLANRNDVHCLGITKDGQPLHPLYVKGDTSLVPFFSPSD